MLQIIYDFLLMFEIAAAGVFRSICRHEWYYSSLYGKPSIVLPSVGTAGCTMPGPSAP